MARSHLDDFLQTCWFQLYDLPELRLPLTVMPWHMANVPLAGFNGVSFPEISGNTETIREGTWPWEHKVLMGVSVGSVVLRKGLTSYDTDFYSWILMAIQGVFKPRRTLLLYNLDRRRYARRAWLLNYCLPEVYRAADFDATASEINIEELTLSVQSVLDVPLGDGFSLA